MPALLARSISIRRESAPIVSGGPAAARASKDPASADPASAVPAPRAMNDLRVTLICGPLVPPPTSKAASRLPRRSLRRSPAGQHTNPAPRCQPCHSVEGIFRN
jgi:hypothetical protein